MWKNDPAVALPRGLHEGVGAHAVGGAKIDALGEVSDATNLLNSLSTSRIFQETHDLGNWVVNFDELLDRRQLLNQDVRVIRYKQSVTQGRNLIISSRAPLGLLRTLP